MKSKKVAFILFISTTLLISIFYPSEAEAAKSMPSGSEIAGISIEGKTEQEVRQMLENEVKIWKTGDELTVISEFEVIEIPRTSFDFNIEETIKEFNERTKRKFTTFFLRPKDENIPLKVTINQEDESVEPLLDTNYIDKDTTSINLIGIAAQLQEGDAQLVYSDEDEIPFKTISEVRIDPTKLEEPNIKQAVMDLDGFVLPANGSFSFLEDVIIDEEADYPGKDTTLIGSGFYELFLQTNFEIVERSKHLGVPANIDAGMDAVINIKDNKDLVVINPNDISFMVSTSEEDEEMVLKLEATLDKFGFDNELEKEKITPQTIYRYSHDLSPGEEQLIYEGKNGLSVHVSRDGYDADSDARQTDLVSHDIYLSRPNVILASVEEENLEEIQEEDELEEFIEDDFSELEESVEEFRNELEVVQEEVETSEDMDQTVELLTGQLENLQAKQTNLVELITVLQTEVNETSNTSEQATEKNEERFENSLNEFYDVLDERVQILEKSFNELSERLTELQ